MAIVRELSGVGPRGSRRDASFARYEDAITPSDTVIQPVSWDSIYVGGTGDVTVKNNLGNTITYKAVPVGTQLWVGGVVYVMATGTTATLLIGQIDQTRRAG